MKKLITFLKLNTDPDIQDTGIVAFRVVVPGDTTKAELLDQQSKFKDAINGLDNDRVIECHRVECLDDKENIAISDINGVEVSDDTRLGLYSYTYLASLDPKEAYQVVSL